jgi:hypothetical protein
MIYIDIDIDMLFEKHCFGVKRICLLFNPLHNLQTVEPSFASLNFTFLTGQINLSFHKHLVYGKEHVKGIFYTLYNLTLTTSLPGRYYYHFISKNYEFDPVITKLVSGNEI